MEVSETWMRALQPLRASYAQVVSEPREDNFGIALFSRLPMMNSAVIELGQAEVPSIAATISVGGKNVFLLGTHPLPPGSAEYARLRNDQLQNIAAMIRKQSRPAIVIGDLNTTPWSPYFSDLLQAGGFINTSQGLGLYNSWPSWCAWAGIPIDHCLVTPSWSVFKKQLGPQVGSDHLPVIIELQLAVEKR
jgi:endonuclease/exonuclease/phosphatase (EEP) superfamily protein YafD